MKRLNIVFLVTMFALGLSACETMKGMGKDLGKLGEKIEEAADK